MSVPGFFIAVFTDAVLFGFAYVVMWILTGTWYIEWSFSNWWTRLSIVVGILMILSGVVLEDF